MQNDINELLIEVRKSYRILYIFQSRILDLISFIGGNYGLTYEGGHSKFSNVTPRNGKGRLDLLAWDWLNLYYYDFHFNDFKRNNSNYSFSIFLLSDDGFFRAKKNNKNINEAKLSEFEDVNFSNSKLIFVLGKNYWADWGQGWKNLEFTLENEGQKVKEDNSKMIFKSYYLNKFMDEETCLTTMRDFESYAQKYDMNINVVNKRI